MWKQRGGVLLAVVLAAAGARTAPIQMGYDKDGMITVNGARTFIVGSYYAGNKDHPPALESYQELKEAGFNLVSASGEQSALAQQAGLMFWTSIGTLDLGKREESAQQIRERVLALKDHPALAFYEQFDEPAWT
ncbi:MAG: hypothetical protein HYV26_15705, partial [Candidatus Hydrogenedentes bacterium]|nr:hypothetical protein [Candidatus Hydrogenedentota bacterium]